jgi:hypothetical protein
MSTVTATESIPPAEALAEIREIIERIKSGEYLHNQQEFCDVTECGTTFCIAGWKVFLDSEASALKFASAYDLFYQPGELDRLYKDMVCSDSLFSCVTPWQYAQHAWNLTEKQARFLFGSDLSLQDIDDNLSKLEELLAINNRDYNH